MSVHSLADWDVRGQPASTYDPGVRHAMPPGPNRPPRISPPREAISPGSHTNSIGQGRGGTPEEMLPTPLVRNAIALCWRARRLCDTG
jgi:hypothetical protein